MENHTAKEMDITLQRIKEKEENLDKIRGCLLGGAVGDALGYPVEFFDEAEIFSCFGENGIQEYVLDKKSQKALISDDTQMTLFTANGILVADAMQSMRGISSRLSTYIAMSYQDWLRTQELSFEESKKIPRGYMKQCISWVSDVPELYSRRAPGTTCLSALRRQKREKPAIEEFIREPQNNSKGCGGIMRIAPIALAAYPHMPIKKIDLEGAEAAAITHGHSLGYMPAAVLTHIIRRIICPEKPQTLKEIILEARDTITELFAGDGYLKKLTKGIDLAVRLSENTEKDLDNINQIGEGWVAEETLGIAVYCALRHQDNFSAGVTAAVNHKGDSDSTGAVTGNILGALLGCHAIDEKWKTNLELGAVILEIADDLYHGWMSELSSDKDPDWIRKYIKMRWKDKHSDQ